MESTYSLQQWKNGRRFTWFWRSIDCVPMPNVVMFVQAKHWQGQIHISALLLALRGLKMVVAILYYIMVFSRRRALYESIGKYQNLKDKI